MIPTGEGHDSHDRSRRREGGSVHADRARAAGRGDRHRRWLASRSRGLLRSPPASRVGLAAPKARSPGYAKGKLVNALKIAGEILDTLPENEWAPEATEKKEGFVHPVRVEGIAEKATIEFIVRDFENDKLKAHGERLKLLAEEVVNKYKGATMDFMIQEQYRNMKEILDRHPEVVSYAAEAISRTGLKVKTESIRGGTDGSRLSFMGLPARIFSQGCREYIQNWNGSALMIW